MRYHNITTDDMLNGDGLRVVLWVSGCSHHCSECQNPVTWDPENGIIFDNDSIVELKRELDKDYISGITFSGGDPLHDNNIYMISVLIDYVRDNYPFKTVWLYSGYRYEDLDSERLAIVNKCDVFVDGRFVEELKNPAYHWAGSTNQRVIDIKKTLKEGKVMLHE